MQTDFCRATANNFLDFCQKGAQSDYQLALSSYNISNSGDGQLRKQNEASDFEDAKQRAQASTTSESQLAKSFGPMRYDPVINSANFTNAVTSQYFPPAPGTTYVYEGQTARPGYSTTVGSRPVSITRRQESS